jgi:hypothetical protein
MIDTPLVLWNSCRHTQKQNKQNMRTKTLLMTAAVFAAGVGASMAQVYSVNAVGYVNIPVVNGYNLIANPLNSSNNAVGAVIPTALDQTTIYTWNKNAQSFNQADTYQNFAPPDNGWYDGDGNPSVTVIPPGAAFYLVSPAATTVTFVGEVPQGNLTNQVVANFGFYSSIVPQAGTLPALQFPAVDNLSVYFFNSGSQSYGQAFTYYDFAPPDNGWYDGDGNPANPSLTVGQGCLVANPGGSVNWVRNFSVNN